MSSPSSALTVNGTIVANTAWHLSDSPVVIQGADLVVAAAATLTVDAGVVVKVENGRAIAIYGVLTASGTGASPVYFTSVYDESVASGTSPNTAQPPQPGSWVGLQFLNSATASALSSTTIRYAGGYGSQYNPNGTTFGAQIASVRAAGLAPIISGGEISLGAADGLRLEPGAGSLSLNGVYIATHTQIGINAEALPSGTLTLTNVRLGKMNAAAVRINPNVFPVDGGGNILAAASAVTGFSVKAGRMYFSGTWPAIFPYVIDNDFEIGTGTTGVTLTINAGAVIKTNSAIGVRDRLLAQGTLSAPIYFTSRYDTSVGSTTEPGLLPASPSRGNWVGLQFLNAAGASSLTNVILRYAGAGGTQFSATGSNFFGQIASVRVVGVSPTINGIEISLGAADGVRLEAGASSLNMSNIYLANHTGYGLNAEALPPGSLYLKGDRFGGNGQAAIRINANVFPVDQGGNVMETTNGINGISVKGGRMTSTGTWTSLFPYVIDNDLEIGSGDGSVTLTVSSGAVVKTNSAIGVRDRLLAQGTLAAPIYFTSRFDTSVGGTTEPGLLPATPSRGNWVGLQFLNAAGASSLTNVILRYAGGGGTQFSATGSNFFGQIASVRVAGVSPAINGIEISLGAADGVRLESGASSLNMANIYLANHAGYGLNAEALPPGSLYLKGDRFGGNGQAAIRINANVFPVDQGGNVMETTNGINGISVKGGRLYYSGTWTNLFAFVLDNDFEIGTGTTGVTLTLGPGVVVKTNNAIGVRDTLSAQGGDAAPVIFTSRYDMSVGGVTEPGLLPASPSRGNWVGLQFLNAASASALNKVIVRYAGGGGTQYGTSGSNFFGQIASVRLVGVSPTIDGFEISHGAADGVRLEAGAGSLNMANIYLLDHSGHGLNAEALAQGSLYLKGDRFGGNGQAAIRINANVFPVDQGGNVMETTNGINGISVKGGRMTSSGAWTNLFSYVIDNDLEIGSGGGSVTLTVSSGAVVKTNSAIGVRDRLLAQGTLSAPIYLTSRYDMSVGGTTEPGLLPASPSRGNWVGLQFLNAAGASSLTNVILRYAGAGGTQFDAAGSNFFGQIASVRVVGVSPTINGIEISQGAADGVRLEAGAGSLNMANINLSNHAGHGLNAQALAQGSLFLGGDRFSKNGLAAIRINPNISPVDLGGNALAFDNGVNGISVAGGVRMTSSATWTNLFPYVIDNDLEIGSGNGAVTLTISSGAVVKTNSAIGVRDMLSVQGVSGAPVMFTSRYDMSVGSVTEPGLLPSNPSPGNWVGLQFMNAAGASRLDNMVVRYAGAYGTQYQPAGAATGAQIAAIRVAGVSPSFNGGEVSLSAADGLHFYSGATSTVVNFNIAGNASGVVSESGSTPVVNFSAITGNTNFGVNNLDASVTLNARSNWWGQASGPANAANPGGTGDKASSNVDFGSFLTTAPLFGAAIQVSESPFTKTRAVHLVLTAQNATQMILSEDPGFAGAVYQPFSVSATFTLSAGDGAKTVYAQFKSASWTSPVVSAQTTLDTTPPYLAITSPANGAITSQNVTLVFVSTDNITPANKLVVKDSLGRLPPFTYTAEGPSTAALTSTDQAGNVSAAAVTFTIDKTPPNAILDLSFAAVRAASVDLSWTVPVDSVTGVASYLFNASSTSLGAQDFSTASSLILPGAPGTKVMTTAAVVSGQVEYFAVKAVDFAGNASAVSNLAIYDPIPPQVTAVSLANGATLSRPVTVTARAADNIAVARVIFSVDGVIQATATIAPYQFLWDTRNFPDGTHALTVTAQDGFGNIASSTAGVLLNYAPPPAPTISAPANGFATSAATITISGNADPLVSVDVLANNLDIATAAVSASGQWSVNATLPFAGNIALTALSFESRGFSPASPPISIVFSNQAPQPPLLPVGTGLAGGQALISWSAPSAGTTPAYYRVYRSTDDTLLVAGSSVPPARLKVADNIAQLSYAQTPAVDDLYFYGVTAVDGVGRESALSNVVYVVTDRVPPTARVVITTPAPLGVFTYNPSFAVSKTLQQPPILTFTPPGGQPIALNAAPLTSTLWKAAVTITAAMSSGTATFAFQGTDLSGNVGTALSSATIAIRTVGPAGTMVLSKVSPLSAGPLIFNLSLDESAASPPTLAVTPRNRPAIPVLPAAAAPFDGTTWTGTIIISSSTGDGEADLSFSAADALGNGGALLLGSTFFVIKTVPPGAPLKLGAFSLPAGKVQLSWSAPFGERPALYRVYRDSAPLSAIAPAADGSGAYLDTPAPGQHQYQVSSLDLAGNESAATGRDGLAKATPPLPPINVTAGFNSFNQIQVTWSSGSADTAKFNLYRTTYTLASTVGAPAPLQGAATPFADSPSADAVYHYAVTALDAANNESALSTEAVVTWANGAPAIAILGVADGAYSSANVTPSYRIVDLTLDPTTVSATLDGQPFVSGTTVTAEGRHSLTVSAANVAHHFSTATAAFVIDKTAPGIAFGVANGAALNGAAAPAGIAVTVTDLNPGTSSFILANQMTGLSAAYLPGAPINQNGRYVLSVTATDLAGNVSTAAVSFTVAIGPPPPANLTVTVGASARISWTSPEPDVVAYRVYRDGSRVSSSLLSDTFFQDTGLTAGQHVYQVSAIDANGIEGPKAQATVPAASLVFNPIPLTRGFFDALHPTVQNNSGAPLTAGPAQLTVTDAAGNTASATATAVTVDAGQTGPLEGVIATPAGLGASTLHIAVALPTDPQASVFLTGDFALTASDPALPILETFPGTLAPGTISPVQVRLYNRGTAPMDVITAQVTNSTVAAVNNVQVLLQTTQGTVLGSGGLLQTGNGAGATSANGRQVFFVTIPPGQSFLFDPIGVMVPNIASLNVAAVISTPTFNLPGSAVPGARSFVGLPAAAAVVSVPYTATSSADKAFYDQGTTVTISGRAVDSASGLPTPNVLVAAHVLSNGFDRRLLATTDGSGSYSAAFNPLPNEAGTYATYASHPNVVTAGVQSTFTIVGLAFQFASFSATMAQNGTIGFIVGLTNTGASAITGLSASTMAMAGAGVSLALDPRTLPASLQAGQSASLGLTLAALPQSSSATMSLTVSESHGFVRTLPITATVVPAQVISVVTPQQFSIGLLGGDSRTISLQVQNKGFDTWRGVSLTLPALPWVTISGQADLGDIPPGGNANVSLQVAPPSSLPNQTYAPSPLLNVISLNAPAVPVNAAIAVTSSRKGDVLVSVINADKPKDISGNGVPIPGGKVTLVSLDVPGLTFAATADLNGVAAFSQLPAGNYQWRAEAQGFQTGSANTVVEPGMSNPVQAILATAVVSYQWTVVPTNITDRYDIALTLTFRTDVLAPVITVDPPSLSMTLNDGTTAYTQLTFTNRGLISAFNVKVLPSTPDPRITMTIPTPTIPELKAGQSVVVPIKIFFDPPTPPQACTPAQASVGGDYGYSCQNGGPESGALPTVPMAINNASPPPSCPSNPVPQNAGGPPPNGVPTNTPYVDVPLAASPAGGQAPPPSGCGNAPGGKCKGNCKKRRCGGTDPLTGSNTDGGGGGAGPGPGSPSLEIAPAFNGSLLANGPWGYGWGTDYFERIQVQYGNPEYLNVYDGHGGAIGFFFATAAPPACGAGACISMTPAIFVPPPGVHDQLLAAAPSVGGVPPSSLDYRRTDGTTIHFVSDTTLLASLQLQQGVLPHTYFPTLVTDRNGNTVTYSYDGNGNLLQLTDVHGRTVKFGYGGGHVTSILDNAGRQAFSVYDSSGNRISETDVNGDVTQYAYDANHNMTKVTYPNGGVRTYAYDSAGRVVQESDDNGNNQNTYVYTSTTVGGVMTGTTTVTDALGRVTTHGWRDFNGSRQATTIVDPAGGVTSFAYDSDAMLIRQVDPLGRTTSYKHDANGNTTSLTDAAGGTTQTTYDPFFNQPTSVVDPGGNRTIQTYDGVGNLVQTQDALNNLTQTAYDRQGHPVASKDPVGNNTAYTYDTNGALASITDPLGRTTYRQNDGLSRVTQESDPGGNLTQYSYDNAGDLVQVRDALNNTTSYSYQAGREKRLQKSFTDANGHTTVRSYDVLGRLTGTINPLNQSNSLSYDADGRLTAIITRNGQPISFAYDKLSQPVRISASEGNTNLNYDSVGNVIGADSYNGTAISLSYDPLRRPAQVVETFTGGYSVAIKYTYDANGNKTQMATPWGNFNYTYDQLNRLTRITNPYGQSTTYSYDAQGRIKNIAYPNGIAGSIGYDKASQVTQIVHQRLSDNTAVAFTNYSYDSKGNRTSISDAGGSHSFSYDKLNRVTLASHSPGTGLPAQSEQFTYDAIGNRISDGARTGYTYDSANRLQWDSSFTYTSDAEGNSTSRTSRTTGQKTIYVYNSENKLIEVDGPMGAIATYKYDALGNRVEKNVGGVVTRYVYDGLRVLAILDGNNNLLQLFTNGHGVDSPIIMRNSGKDYFFHPDANGNVAALTDSNGAVVESVEYQAFGHAVIKDAQGKLYDTSTVGNPFLFASREFDPETGLYFFRMRFLNSDSGRFLSEDSVRFVDLYSYAKNNPLTYRDPSGALTDCEKKWLSGALAGGLGGLTLGAALRAGASWVAVLLGLTGGAEIALALWLLYQAWQCTEIVIPLNLNSQNTSPGSNGSGPSTNSHGPTIL